MYDLLKFFYNATGIIPAKGEDILDITISSKSVHKALTRVAEEEGCNFLEKLLINIVKNFFLLSLPWFW